jgi:hypothetical protein
VVAGPDEIGSVTPEELHTEDLLASAEGEEARERTLEQQIVAVREPELRPL